MAKKRIILVDDHEVVRVGLKTLLERHPDYQRVRRLKKPPALNRMWW